MATRCMLAGALALVLALSAGLLRSAAAQDGDGAADAMPRESLLETAPASIRAANHVLSKTFERGAKDMDAYTYLAKLLLQHALNLAERHPDQALDYKRAALPITYNLAANTWPGWGDPQAAAISDHHRRLGLAAAELDVALTAQAAPTVRRRFNSHWILGAHLIAAGRTSDAVAAFATCRGLARDAGDEQRATMAQGWIHLANTLGGRDESEALAAIEARLAEQGGDGAFYAKQYAAALAAFGGSR